MAVIFFFTFAEFIWEFTHHYLYPEALQEWVNLGKNAEKFSKNYDNYTIITIGVIGRYFQFISVIWLSLHFYKMKVNNSFLPPEGMGTLAPKTVRHL